MAFDLIFFKNKNDKTKLQEIVDYFDALPNFESKTYDDLNYSFVYFNENNDVYFIINYNLAYNLENQELTIPDDYEFSYLVFTINYLRATFFAKEAIPLVTEFAMKFNLLILNPQTDHLSLSTYSVDELINSYNSSNIAYCKEFSEQIPLRVLANEKSNYAYTYLNEYKKIQSTIEDQISVPKMQFLKDTSDNNVYTAITWNNAVPIILPKCDFVIVLKEVKSLFGLVKKQKPCVIEYEVIMQEFANLLQPFEHTVEDLFILPIESSNQAKVIFYALPDTTFEDLESVNTDDFIDFEI
ncbi:MAG: hypothetical protein K0Q49_750 [Haloplasmataceae bacterium]|jgi:hypothetical protein|nr:hypothetical protein [Haloplasmataceae bacterium]